MQAAWRANGVPEATIAAYVSQRQQTEAVTAVVAIHPLNYPVIALLALTEGCWDFVSGQRSGYRYSDAQTVLGWHDVPPDVTKRLPIAINAILRG